MRTTDRDRGSPRVQAYYREVPDYRTLVEVPVGRMVIPHSIFVVAEWDDQPRLGKVELTVTLIDRKLEISNMQAYAEVDHGLDIEDLRRLDTSALLRQAISSAVRTETRAADGSFITESPIENPDPLARVALTYSLAYALGERPGAAVARDLGITPGAAAQRIRRARALGYLPPTTPGKAS